MSTIQERVRDAVTDVPDFPKPGILFKDITPVVADPVLLRDVTKYWAKLFAEKGVTHVAAVESRGFLFGAPLAVEMQVPLIVIRKPGKLPRPTISVSFDLEYGQDTLHIHEGVIGEGDRVLVMDDVLATGGTAAAAGELVAKCGAQVAAYGFLIELEFLHGRKLLGDTFVDSLHIY